MASILGSGRILASRTRETITEMKIFGAGQDEEAEAWENE